MYNYVIKDIEDDIGIYNINNIIFKDKNTQFKAQTMFIDHGINIGDPYIDLKNYEYRDYLKKNCIIPVVSKIKRLNINFIELYRVLKEENIINNLFPQDENYYKSCECLDELVKFNSKKVFLSIVSRLALIK